MFINQIIINNFRQFKEEQSIKFSCNPSQNVTLVMGENGSGKTTLEQAFLWVLYGETEFRDKKVINKKSIDMLANNDYIETEIRLYIEEENREYEIKRTQRYIKKSYKIEQQQAVLQVQYKKENGETDYKRGREAQNLINSILPNELSKFFFFDGERIKNMSDEIQEGRSKEFANAVRGLVGLNAVMNAIEHIKDSRGTNTVIGRYNKKIDTLGDYNAQKISKELDEKFNEYDEKKNKYNAISKNVSYYEREIGKLDQEMVERAPAEKLREEYEKLKMHIVKKEADKRKQISEYFKYFNKHGLSFFSRPLIKHIMGELKKAKITDKGIPHIQDDTINFLIRRGYCICGNKIGNFELEQLNKLLEYIPPKSISTLIEQNMQKSNMYLNESETFFDVISNYFKDIRELNKSINNLDEEKNNKYSLIADMSRSDDLKEKIEDYNNILIQQKDELSQVDRRIGQLESEIANLKSEEQKYININKNNEKYIIYREYARKIYNYLSSDYSRLEKGVKERLEKKINEIFKNILEGDLILKLSDDYSISVKVNELSQHNDVERSTAQNYSIIFAFIAGVIELAKEKSEEESGIFDNATNYPLVMDAPLSAFDKKRISNICNTIPNIANQVIIFIKDTDGDVAKKQLYNFVGMKYKIIKLNELEAKIERSEADV